MLYGQMYSVDAESRYQAFQPVRVKFQALNTWFLQLQSGQRHDVAQYDQAWATFNQQYGGGQ